MRERLEPCVCVWRRGQAPLAEMGEPNFLESARDGEALGQESLGCPERMLGRACMCVWEGEV